MMKSSLHLHNTVYAFVIHSNIINMFLSHYCLIWMYHAWILIDNVETGKEKQLVFKVAELLAGWLLEKNGYA